jgi:hypothetical protein
MAYSLACGEAHRAPPSLEVEIDAPRRCFVAETSAAALDAVAFDAFE